MKLTKAPTDADSKDIAHHPGMYREFRSLDLHSKTIETVIDMACPGCGEVWMLKRGFRLVGGTLVDETGAPGLLTCYRCNWAGHIDRGEIESLPILGRKR